MLRPSRKSGTAPKVMARTSVSTAVIRLATNTIARPYTTINKNVSKNAKSPPSTVLHASTANPNATVPDLLVCCGK